MEQVILLEGNVLYEEHHLFYTMIFALVLVLIAILIPLLFYPRRDAEILLILLAAIFISILLMFYRYSLIITSDGIMVGFPVWKAKIRWSDVANVETCDLKFIQVGGYGIRVTMHGGKRMLVINIHRKKYVLLEMKRGKYPYVAFSTENPEVVKGYISQEIEIWKNRG